MPQPSWSPNRLNLRSVELILRYPKIQTIHLRLLRINTPQPISFQIRAFDRNSLDDILAAVQGACLERDSSNESCAAFCTKYQDQEVMDAFIKHAVLQVLLALPGVRELTFLDQDSRETKSVESSIGLYDGASYDTKNTKCQAFAKRRHAYC